MERALSCMERDLPCALRRAVRRHAVGRARGGGASLKGFGSRCLDHSVLDHDLKRRCTPEGVRRIVGRFASTAAHLSGRKHRGRGACLESLFDKWLDSNLDSKLRLGRFWSPLGSVLGALGCVLGALGAVLVALGDSWGALGGLLGALGRVLGALGAVLEAS